VTTAVQWSWTPVATFTIVPRWSRVAGLAVAVGIASLMGSPVLLSNLAALVVLAVEHTLLVRRVRAALARTTARAAPRDD
jgi:hypothetical protein